MTPLFSLLSSTPHPDALAPISLPAVDLEATWKDVPLGSHLERCPTWKPLGKTSHLEATWKDVLPVPTHDEPLPCQPAHVTEQDLWSFSTHSDPWAHGSG